MVQTIFLAIRMSECPVPAAIIECDLSSTLHAMLHLNSQLKYGIYDPCSSPNNNYRHLLCFFLYTLANFLVPWKTNCMRQNDNTHAVSCGYISRYLLDWGVSKIRPSGVICSDRLQMFSVSASCLAPRTVCSVGNSQSALLLSHGLQRACVQT